MSYDSFYRKTHDRQASLKLLKRRDIILLIISIILIPAVVFLIHYLISVLFSRSLNIVSAILISGITVVIIIFDFYNRIFTGFIVNNCIPDNDFPEII